MYLVIVNVKLIMFHRVPNRKRREASQALCFLIARHVKALFYKQKNAELVSDASLSISSFPGCRSQVLIQVMNTDTHIHPICNFLLDCTASP